MNPFSPVALARDYTSSLVKLGNVCVDCTTGNGHDTELLARLVGDEGKVLGFDIQLPAIDSTSERLQTSGLQARVELIHANHSTLQEELNKRGIEEVSMVMFNLGYLPGADKSIVTQPGSTIETLQQANLVLRKGGAISLIAYRGHSGGEEEYQAVLNWITELAQDAYEVYRYEQVTKGGVTPVFLWIRKK